MLEEIANRHPCAGHRCNSPAYGFKAAFDVIFDGFRLLLDPFVALERRDNAVRARQLQRSGSILKEGFKTSATTGTR